MIKKYGNYLIHSNGDIYSTKRNIYLKHHVDKYGYHSVTLGGKVYKVHRIVAKMFLPNTENYPQINHMDGKKGNNDYTNLEWCTAYHNNKHARDTGLNNISGSNSLRWECEEFAERVSKKISEGVLKSGSNKGKNNPRYRYLIEHNGGEITRQELSEIILKPLHYVDKHIREVAKGENNKIFLENVVKITDTKKGSQSTNEREL